MGPPLAGLLEAECPVPAALLAGMGPGPATPSVEMGLRGAATPIGVRPGTVYGPTIGA